MPVQPETNDHEMNFRMAELAEDQFAYNTKAEADALAKRLEDISAATKKLDRKEPMIIATAEQRGKDRWGVRAVYKKGRFFGRIE